VSEHEGYPESVAHRPWPLPAGPWVMAQSWHDLLFAHWSVDLAELRPLLPPQLQIDILRGRAWLAVVPFRMTGVRLRGTPAIPPDGALLPLCPRQQGPAHSQ